MSDSNAGDTEDTEPSEPEPTSTSTKRRQSLIDLTRVFPSDWCLGIPGRCLILKSLIDGSKTVKKYLIKMRAM